MASPVSPATSSSLAGLFFSSTFGSLIDYHLYLRLRAFLLLRSSWLCLIDSMITDCGLLRASSK